MDWFEIVGLGMGLVSAVTMWLTAWTIVRQQKLTGEFLTPGARFVQRLHVFWGITLAVLAALVVFN